MAGKDHDATEDVVEDLEELDDLEDVEDEDAALVATDDEDDAEGSLEDLLAQRGTGRRPADETEEDSDLLALVSSEPETPPPLEAIPTKVVPLKDRQEFVCNSCHLVKARSQLADEKRGLCRDCV